MTSTPIRSKWWRLTSSIEFAVGEFIVIGHNVFRILPNEVLILVALGVISIQLRDGRWIARELSRPAAWRRILLIALLAAALRIVLGEFVIDPITNRFWPPAIAPEGTDKITGNLGIALLVLLLVWTFAAFGEEFGYRGHLLRRFADIGNQSTGAYWLGVIVVAILFGIGHWYKGPSGMIDSGIAGLILGAAFMLANKNLWASILAHGFIDTFAVIVVYFGWMT